LVGLPVSAHIERLRVRGLSHGTFLALPHWLSS
jgi:hypothetical protein